MAHRARGSVASDRRWTIEHTLENRDHNPHQLIMRILVLAATAILAPLASGARLRGLIQQGSFVASSTCVAPCTGKSRTFGFVHSFFSGPRGDAFDDLNYQKLFGIRKISIRSDARIDGIQVEYDNGIGPAHGGDGGAEGHDCIVKTESTHDPIVEVIVRSWSEVDALTFVKKSGARCGTYGGSGGKERRLVAPSGMILGAIYGREGDRLDQLGFYWGRDPSTCNEIVSTSGRWSAVTSFPTATKYAVEQGTKHSDTSQRSREWGSEVTTKVSAGFNFKGVAGGVEISSAWSQSTAESYSSMFEQSSTTKTEFTFRPGTLWQWHFETVDPCGTSNTFKDFHITDNVQQTPCCPPGLFADPSNAVGLCVVDAVSQDLPHCPKRNSQ